MLIQGRIAKSSSLETTTAKSAVEKIFFLFSLALILFLIALSTKQILTEQTLNKRVELPNNFTITNVTDVSFTVSWETEKPVTGYLVFGKSANDLTNKVFDNMATGNMSTYVGKKHMVTLTNLEANTEYFFAVVSNEKIIDSINGEKIKAVKTDSESFLNPNLGDL